MLSNIFPQNRAVYEIMWGKYGRAGQASDDNIIWRMRFTCSITKARIHAHIIFNSYCFSTATVVTRTRLRVTIHLHWLSCTPSYISFKSAWASDYCYGFTHDIQVHLSVTLPYPDRDPRVPTAVETRPSGCALYGTVAVVPVRPWMDSQTEATPYVPPEPS